MKLADTQFAKILKKKKKVFWDGLHEKSQAWNAKWETEP